MKTNEVAIIFITGTLTLLVFVFFLLLILIEYRRRQVRHITEKLELKHQYQNEVLQTQIEVQEQSFKYISEELHDNIAQTLSLVKLKLYKTAGKATDENLRNGIETANELLGNVLTDMRTLSHVLNGGLVSNLGLEESIDKELSYVASVKEVATEVTVSGKKYELNAEKKLMVFRTVQEAVINALKHGKATSIKIHLTYEPHMLTLQIEDNGHGFDTNTIPSGKGLGLHNMHVRAKLLGGIEIQSAPEGGTTITLKIRTNES